MFNRKLNLHIITMNRARYLERVLYKCWWCFDKIRVCDGGSTDDTLDVCSKFGCEIVERKWCDNMSEQHNALLSLASKGEWIFILDDDEYPSDELMFKFETLINTSAYNSYEMPSIIELDGTLQCSVPEMIDKIKNHGHEQFHKHILFRFNDNLYYDGDSHYALHGFNWVPNKIVEPIIHFKTFKDVIWCFVYQGFINPGMQGYNIEDARLIKNLFKSVGVTTTQELKTYLGKGNITSELKELFELWKSPEQEAKSRWYQWYFLVLHPEELPEEHGLMNDAIFRHLREVGGLNSKTIWDEEGREFLPIGHLDIPGELRWRINKNLIQLPWSKSSASIIHHTADINREDDINMEEDTNMEADTNMEKGIIEIPEFGKTKVLTEEELQEVIDLRCDKAYSDDVYNLLYKYAKQVDDGDILEIGAWHGKSAGILGAVMKFFNKGRLFSVDIEKSFYPMKYESYNVASCGTTRIQLFIETLMRMGIEDVVIPILCSSREASTFLDIPFQLVYIDGNHDYNNCFFDISTWGGHLVPGGIILIHDYVSQNSVVEAVDNYFHTSQWEHLETVGEMIVWQKKS